MKITFVSSSSVDQISAWSGTPYHMFRELKKTFPDINNIKIQPPSKKITGIVGTGFENAGHNVMIVEK